MLYESVRQSAALFKKKMKQKQTYEQIQLFRWKFVVLGLGVVLVILVGICSELIKTLTSRKNIPINTTFLSQLLSQSQIFGNDIERLQQFLYAMKMTENIRFDKCSKLYIGYQTSGESIYKLISGKNDILVFLQFRDPQVNKTQPSRVGIYMRTGLDKIDLNSNQKTFTSDPKDQQNSIIFNLNYRKLLRLNRTTSCYLSTYNNENKHLSFIQLINLDRNSINSTINVKMENGDCFKKGDEKEPEIINYVGQLLNLNFKEGQKQKQIKLQLMEVFYLQFADVSFDN